MGSEMCIRDSYHRQRRHHWSRQGCACWLIALGNKREWVNQAPRWAKEAMNVYVGWLNARRNDTMSPSSLPPVGAGKYPGKGHATGGQASLAGQVPQASTWQVALAGPHWWQGASQPAVSFIYTTSSRQQSHRAVDSSGPCSCAAALTCRATEQRALTAVQAVPCRRTGQLKAQQQPGMMCPLPE